MQDLPDKATILDALGRFLDANVRPRILDSALAFRIRIAVHLAELVAREIRAEDEIDARELSRLEHLMSGDLEPGTTDPEQAERRAQRRQKILTLKRTWAQKVRNEPLDTQTLKEMHAEMRRVLIDKLSIAQPRFDTSLEIE